MDFNLHVLCVSLKDGDSNSLTTDNLERHGQLSHHPALPDGGALLSEAKLQSIMSFLDEMEKSEQERPRSVTSGSHREVGICSFISLPVFITLFYKHRQNIHLNLDICCLFNVCFMIQST